MVSTNDGRRPIMSDYRNSDFHNPEDPFRRDSRLDPDVQASNTAWGWIAAAVFVAVLLAVAFGVGHQPGQGTNTASNDITPPPAATRMAPPATTTLPPAATPAPATPMMPAPAAPAQGSQ
jgi:hypothetical protein